MKNKYEILVLDWDGTLFDSMPIKVNNASLILRKYLHSNYSYHHIPSLEDLKKAYLRFSGVSRRQLFDNILQSLVGIKLFDQAYEDLSYQFTLLNQEKLTSAKLFKDTIKLLEKARQGVWSSKFVISSSAPEPELHDMTSFHLTNEQKSIFLNIMGTRKNFRKGFEHFDWILQNFSCTPEDILFVGDDKMDIELAQHYGANWLRIIRETPENPTEKKIISSLIEVEQYLIKTHE